MKIPNPTCITVLKRNRANRIYYIIYLPSCLSACLSKVINILKNCLTLLWGLANLKSSGQTSRLEMQVRVDASVLSPKAGNTGRVSVLQP